MARKKLRLYVWEDCLTDFYSGVMFAYASSVEEARALITQADIYENTWKDLKKEPKIIEEPYAYIVHGGG